MRGQMASRRDKFPKDNVDEMVYERVIPNLY